MEPIQKEKLKNLTPAQLEDAIIRITAERDDQDVAYKQALEERADAKHKYEYEQALARIEYESKNKKVDFIKAEIAIDSGVEKAYQKFASSTGKYEGEKLKKEAVEAKQSVLQSLVKLKALDYDRTGRQ